MIPEFQENGNLPKGIHKASLQETEDRFGTGSARRQWLFHNFAKIIALAKSTGALERVIVWGSFVSRKESPRDLDLLLLMSPSFTVDEVGGDASQVFDHTQARIVFGADIFWSRSSVAQGILDSLLETYQVTREFESRGILEVVIDD